METKINVDYWDNKYSATPHVHVQYIEELTQEELMLVVRKLEALGGKDYLDDTGDGDWYVGFCKGSIDIWVTQGEKQYGELAELAYQTVSEVKKQS